MNYNKCHHRLFAMTDEQRLELFNLVMKFQDWYEKHNEDKNKPSDFPDELVDNISRRLEIGDKDVVSQWTQIGAYYFLKRGNSFYAIETMMLGDTSSYIGAVYSFDIKVSNDMGDYLLLAKESGLKFTDDAYRLAYGVAKSLQLENAIAIKITTNQNELYLWSRQWMLLAKDV